MLLAGLPTVLVTRVLKGFIARTHCTGVELISHIMHSSLIYASFPYPFLWKHIEEPAEDFTDMKMDLQSEREIAMTHVTEKQSPLVKSKKPDAVTGAGDPWTLSHHRNYS